ncbi:MAG: amidase [Armatimonadota bacterium]|nr:amidase [Armatimonadota bacterium]
MVLAAVSADLAALASAVRGGRLSSVDLVERCLERIRDTGERLRAFIHVDAEGAREAAQQRDMEARRGQIRGPLHGIPVAVKDLFDQAGLPTTAGAAIRRGHRAQTTATAVHRLLDAGAVVIGKTNLHEFAFGVTSVNPHFGAVANPWDPERVAGGSSGGSAAAVAAGCCAAALGTDTGGSIRIPAALCGVVGLKPTFGRVSRHGVVPLAWSFDTVGPMARSVADAALLLGVLAGPDPQDPLTGGSAPCASRVPPAPPSFRIGRLRGPLFDEELDVEVGTALERACTLLVRAGGRVEEVGLEEALAGQAAQTTILFAEASAYHRRAYPGRLAEYGPDVRELLAAGATIPATAYVDAQRVQGMVIRQIRHLLTDFDALICAAVPVQAPRIEDVDPTRGEGWRRARAPLSRLTRLFNLTGLPAVVVPVEQSRSGLPLGVQLAAAPGEEERLLAIAAVLEAATGWSLPILP